MPNAVQHDVPIELRTHVEKTARNLGFRGFADSTLNQCYDSIVRQFVSLPADAGRRQLFDEMASFFPNGKAFADQLRRLNDLDPYSASRVEPDELARGHADQYGEALSIELVEINGPLAAARVGRLYRGNYLSQVEALDALMEEARRGAIEDYVHSAVTAATVLTGWLGSRIHNIEKMGDEVSTGMQRQLTQITHGLIGGALVHGGPLAQFDSLLWFYERGWLPVGRERGILSAYALVKT